MNRLSSFAVLLISAALVSGCASSGKTYPSLEIRDEERVGGSFESGAAPTLVLTPSPLSANSAERARQLEAEGRSAHQAFARAVPRARTAANRSRGASLGSERWSDAEVLLSDLDSLRSRTAIALGDLDILYVDTTLAFEEREIIASARQNVIALVEEEDRILSQLRGR